MTNKEETIEKNNRSERSTFMTTPDCEADINKLKDINPGFSRSLLIRLSVKRAAEQEMEIGFVSSNSKLAYNRKPKQSPKESWCSEFGGSVEDGVCTINKYEILPSGHMRKSPRLIALTAFPPDKDDFRKQVLGNYETVELAEVDYQEKGLK